MTLEILNREMVIAMKERNKLKKDTISSLISAVKKAAIDERCKDNITEELVDKVILKEKKTVQEMIDTCPATRTDLLDEYKANMEIVNEYAPKLITDEKEIEMFIRGLDFDLVPANRSSIMKELKGKADKKIAKKVLGEMLK